MVRFDWLLVSEALDTRLCFYKDGKVRVLPCFFVKDKNISLKRISCIIVPESGKGL